MITVMYAISYVYMDDTHKVMKNKRIGLTKRYTKSV